MTPRGRVTVRVPATSANLGPAFDSAGLALGLYDEVVVDPAPDGVVVEVAGEGAGDVPLDESHLVVASLLATVQRLGGRLDGLRLRARNAIPHGRGLGSSAAAVVAGVLAGRALVPEASLTEADLLDLAAGLEGHPDNVASCLLGGLTLAWADPAGHFRAVRLEAHTELRPVVFVPPDRLATETARSLLPAAVAHAAATANAGRAALLVHALTAAPDLLLEGTADQLHQDYREPAMPASLVLVGRLRAAGVPAVVSGAGPSVLALGAGRATPELAPYCPGGWRFLPLSVDRRGATVQCG